MIMRTNIIPEEVLKQYFGYDEFREGQKLIIEEMLENRDVLGIMPTGAGKSICFQVPALMKEGITIVISPLISLMQDQVKALNQAGVSAAYINSSLTPGQVEKALYLATTGRYKIVYVAPERLLTDSFLSFARNVNVAMLTVDEAHCISQWGQDFRPSYAKIPEFLSMLPRRPMVSAFTATATNQVKEDVIRLLELQDPYVLVTGFDRENLYFEVKRTKKKMEDLLDFLEERPEQNGIVYCATRKNVESVCEELISFGWSASKYHAGLSTEERQVNQNDFLYDRVKIMVATNAFGMGIDKSNVNFVVHYNMPKDIESYYQEAGRAGRDGAPAHCLLLYSPQDVMTAKWMIENGRDVTYESEEMAQILKEREHDRLKQMTFYSTTNRCLRQYILRYFGENLEQPCDKCGNCDNEFAVTQSVGTEQKIRRKPARNQQVVSEERKELYTRLRMLRGKIADGEGVPAFVVFGDATLIDMCEKLPATSRQFMKVSGVGATKLEKYGARFIEVIRTFCVENDIQIIEDNKKTRTTIKKITKMTDVILPTDEILMEVEITEEKVSISEINTRINAVLMEHGCTKMTAVRLGDWLIKKGYLELVTKAGTNQKVPTELGFVSGIEQENRKIRGNEYQINLYGEDMQRLIVQHMREIK